MRTKWSEKASRLAKELNLSELKIEALLGKSETKDVSFSRGTSDHRVVFMLKDDEIDAEVILR